MGHRVVVVCPEALVQADVVHLLAHCAAGITTGRVQDSGTIKTIGPKLYNCAVGLACGPVEELVTMTAKLNNGAVRLLIFKLTGLCGNGGGTDGCGKQNRSGKEYFHKVFHTYLLYLMVLPMMKYALSPTTLYQRSSSLWPTRRHSESILRRVAPARETVR